VNWTHLAQDRDRWQVIVNTDGKPQVKRSKGRSEVRNEQTLEEQVITLRTRLNWFVQRFNEVLCSGNCKSFNSLNS